MEPAKLGPVRVYCSAVPREFRKAVQVQLTQKKALVLVERLPLGMFKLRPASGASETAENELQSVPDGENSQSNTNAGTSASTQSNAKLNKDKNSLPEEQAGTSASTEANSGVSEVRGKEKKNSKNKQKLKEVKSDLSKGAASRAGSSRGRKRAPETPDKVGPKRRKRKSPPCRHDNIENLMQDFLDTVNRNGGFSIFERPKSPTSSEDSEIDIEDCKPVEQNNNLQGKFPEKDIPMEEEENGDPCPLSSDSEPSLGLSSKHSVNCLHSSDSSDEKSDSHPAVESQRKTELSERDCEKREESSTRSSAATNGDSSIKSPSMPVPMNSLTPAASADLSDESSEGEAQKICAAEKNGENVIKSLSKPVPKKKNLSRAAVADSSDESSEDEVQKPRAAKKNGENMIKGPSKPVPKKKNLSRAAIADSSDESSEDEAQKPRAAKKNGENMIKGPSKPVPKKKSLSRAAIADSSDESSEDEVQKLCAAKKNGGNMIKSPTKPMPKKNSPFPGAVTDSSDESLEDEVQKPHTARKNGKNVITSPSTPMSKRKGSPRAAITDSSDKSLEDEVQKPRAAKKNGENKIKSLSALMLKKKRPFPAVVADSPEESLEDEVQKLRAVNKNGENTIKSPSTPMLKKSSSQADGADSSDESLEEVQEHPAAKKSKIVKKHRSKICLVSKKRSTLSSCKRSAAIKRIYARYIPKAQENGETSKEGPAFLISPQLAVPEPAHEDAETNETSSCLKSLGKNTENEEKFFDVRSTRDDSGSDSENDDFLDLDADPSDLWNVESLEEAAATNEKHQPKEAEDEEKILCLAFLGGSCDKNGTCSSSHEVLPDRLVSTVRKLAEKKDVKVLIRFVDKLIHEKSPVRMDPELPWVAVLEEVAAKSFLKADEYFPVLRMLLCHKFPCLGEVCSQLLRSTECREYPGELYLLTKRLRRENVSLDSASFQSLVGIVMKHGRNLSKAILCLGTALELCEDFVPESEVLESFRKLLDEQMENSSDQSLRVEVAALLDKLGPRLSKEALTQLKECVDGRDWKDKLAAKDYKGIAETFLKASNDQLVKVVEGLAEYFTQSDGHVLGFVDLLDSLLQLKRLSELKEEQVEALNLVVLHCVSGFQLLPNFQAAYLVLISAAANRIDQWMHFEECTPQLLLFCAECYSRNSDFEEAVLFLRRFKNLTGADSHVALGRQVFSNLKVKYNAANPEEKRLSRSALSFIEQSDLF